MHRGNHETVGLLVVVLLAAFSESRAQRFMEFVDGPPSVNPYTGKYYHDNSGDYLSIRDTLYAATFSKDSVIYLRSIDSGASWSESHLRLAYGDDMPSEWLVGVSNTTMLFVRDRSPAQVRVSTDGGWSWTTYTIPPVNRIIHVSAGRGDTVYLSGFNPAAGQWQLYRSVDAGRHWNRLKSPLADSYVYDIAQRDGRLVALVPDFSNPLGIRVQPWISDDGGNSWTYVPVPDTGARGIATFLHLSIAIDSTRTIFVRSWGSGIFRRAVADTMWTEVNSGLPPNTSFTSMVMDNHDVLYVGTDGPGVFVSDDGGQQWRETDRSAINGYVRSLGVHDDRVLANAFTRIYRLDRGSRMWHRCATRGGTPSGVWQMWVGPNGDVYSGSGGGNISRTTDDGATWVDCAPTTVSNVTLAMCQVDHTNRVYVSMGRPQDSPGSGAGLLRSTDRGESWESLGHGVPTTNTGEFAFSSKGIYLSAYGFGLYQSTDDGKNWAPVGAGIPSLSVQMVYSTRSETLFAGTSTNGLWRSTDAGETWQDANNGLEQPQVWWMSENIPTGTLFLTTANTNTTDPRELTFDRSIDGGLNWERIDGIANPTAATDSVFELRAIRCNTTGVAFALTHAVERRTGTSYARLYRSLDDGLTWTAVDSLRYGTGWMFFAPDDRLLVPAGRGYYRSVNTTKLAVPAADTVHNNAHLLAVSSCNGRQLDFSLTLQESTHAYVALFDGTGKLVREIDNQFREAGTYHMSCALNAVPSGIYYCVFEAAGERVTTTCSVVR